MKQPLCLRVTSRSLIVGTGGLRSGAMALPKTDKLPFTSASSMPLGVCNVEFNDRSGVTR